MYPIRKPACPECEQPISPKKLAENPELGKRIGVTKAGNAAVDPETPPARSWTSTEIAKAKKLAAAGMCLEAIAEELGRSPASVKKQAWRQRFSLRQPGELRGAVLGEPRGTSYLRVQQAGIKLELWRRLRGDIITGALSIKDLERIAAREARVKAGLPLCPSCSENPQEVEATGYCKPCHLRHLAQAHKDALEDHEAQRELWAWRQTKVRERRRADEI